MNLYSSKEELKDTHFFVTYSFTRNNILLNEVAWNIAIGQSVGNPTVRNKWETDELFLNHSCKIITTKNDREVCIAFPYINLNWKEDGISQLLCMIQGGQSDIQGIDSCRVIDIEIPKLEPLEPTYGISGMRKFCGDKNKPLLGGIIKPKTGISKHVLLEMVKQMIDGGVNFIKEDEILSNPIFCPIEERTELVMNYIHKHGHKVIYSVCINSDPGYILNRVKTVASLGGNSVHINFWSGLGVYKSIRELNLPIFIHFQRSGIETITNRYNYFGIDWKVICKLAAISGVDSIHVGMLGGYGKDSKEGLLPTINLLQSYNVIPALSCGMHPGLVEYIRSFLGDDWMANCGGAIHGHPSGTEVGARAMREAIDRNYGQAYGEAVTKWGVKIDVNQ